MCKVEVYGIKVDLMETDCEHVNWVEVAKEPLQCWNFVLVTLDGKVYYQRGSFCVCPMFCNK
jgi:hypothetical protein